MEISGVLLEMRFRILRTRIRTGYSRMLSVVVWCHYCEAAGVVGEDAFGFRACRPNQTSLELRSVTSLSSMKRYSRRSCNSPSTSCHQGHYSSHKGDIRSEYIFHILYEANRNASFSAPQDLTILTGGDEGKVPSVPVRYGTWLGSPSHQTGHYDMVTIAAS
jgi:hypothetical protein